MVDKTAKIVDEDIITIIPIRTTTAKTIIVLTDLGVCLIKLLSIILLTKVAWIYILLCNGNT